MSVLHLEGELEMKHIDFKEIAIDILIDISGGLLIAIAAYNFASAANFPMVGFNGIGLILYHLFGLPIGTTAFVLNIPVAAACYKLLGRGFLLRSMRTIVITSLIMDFAAPLIPIYEGNAMLAAICTGVLSGLGYAMIYLRESSTGGTDFILMAAKELRPHLSFGNISFAMESVIIILGTVTVSKSIDGLIYGMLISFVMSVVIDRVMYGISAGKMTFIVTDQAKAVAERINQVAGRGTTFIKAEGSFSQEEKDVVMCACSTKQMVSIRRAVKEIDPRAFIIIMESNEVVGAGFKEN